MGATFRKANGAEDLGVAGSIRKDDAPIASLRQQERPENNHPISVGSIKVLLLVGGEGTHLAPVSNGISKGLVTIDQNGTISGAEHASRLFRSLGLADVTLLAKHQAEQYGEFAKRNKYDVLNQEKDSGNGGAVEEAIATFGFDKQYLVISVDTYFSARDAASLINAHEIGTVTWGVSRPNPDLGMESYHGLVINSQKQVIGDVKQHWWKNWGLNGMRLVTKGAVQIIDPRCYVWSAEVFKRLTGNPSSTDLYWDIMPLMEEQNRRRILHGQSSIVNAVIFEDDLIDYGTPERLAITRRRYDLASTKRL
jgi:NDP-sugar pyrophosphorylase family protein